MSCIIAKDKDLFQCVRNYWQFIFIFTKQTQSTNYFIHDHKVYALDNDVIVANRTCQWWRHCHQLNTHMTTSVSSTAEAPLMTSLSSTKHVHDDVTVTERTRLWRLDILPWFATNWMRPWCDIDVTIMTCWRAAKGVTCSFRVIRGAQPGRHMWRITYDVIEAIRVAQFHVGNCRAVSMKPRRTHWMPSYRCAPSTQPDRVGNPTEMPLQAIHR